MFKLIRRYFSSSTKLVPDYACIGFPKCATTYIQDQVFPKLDFETLKSGEFQMDDLGKFQAGIARASSRGKVVAIKQPQIIYKKHLVEILLKSDCKLIISIRNPVQWIKSFYNYRLRRKLMGKDPQESAAVGSFEDLIYKGKAYQDMSIENGMMSRFIVNNVLNNPYYKRENIHFIVQEEFETEHEKVYGELVAFLNRPEAARECVTFKFEYKRKNRYIHFDDSSHDDHLFNVYLKEIESLCLLFDAHTDKNLRAIWGSYYSRDFS